jgi:hypothetical protein
LWPAALLLALGGGFGAASLCGCGTPAAPQPPSLKLPAPVDDLTATRAGDTVTLHWTTPRRTTDRLLIKDPVRAQVCRKTIADNCESAGEITVQAAAVAQFHDTLPAALLLGPPRVIRYFVELKSPHGRSAGLSNAAEILAGTAPAPVAGLNAEVRADGVALHWQAGDATPVRLDRVLLTPSAKKPAKTRSVEGSAKAGKSLMPAAQEPVERNLLAEGTASGTLSGSLDPSAHFGESYSYTAQRVARVEENGHTLELGGPVSEPIRVEVIDRFPPAVPRDLAAVAAAEDKSIDLSWSPDTDADLAGYIVYRYDADKDAGTWERLSGAQPVVPAAWRDTTATPGHSYRYRVTAIDQTGHESAPSEEAQETLPNP